MIMRLGVGGLKYFSRQIDCMPSEETTATLYLPSLSLNEMKVLFPQLSSEELQFRYDVIGGNPRKMNVYVQRESLQRFYEPVTEVVRLMFGEEFVPSRMEEDDYKVGNRMDKKDEKKRKKAMGAWAISTVVQELGAAWMHLPDTSIFKDYHITNSFQRYSGQYASRFLRLVAGALKGSLERSELERLHWFLFLSASCGIDEAFEFTAHKQLTMEGNSPTRWCLHSSGEFEALQIGKKRTFLIRKMEDIQNLPEGSYGIPTIDNFSSLLDAVMPPNMGVKMITSTTVSWDGSSWRKYLESFLPTLLASLGIEESAFTMVFVVPKELLPNFVFPINSGAVKMVVTTLEGKSKKAFQTLFKQLPGRSLKRKHLS